MALHRNVSSVPLDGFAEGRQVFPQQDVDLSDEDLALEAVSTHLQQRTLVPVTMAADDQPAQTAQARSRQEA